MARQVTVICGPPCAGKSTWVAERAVDGDVVVDFDQIARRFGSRTDHDHTDAVKAKVNAEIERLFDGIAGSDDVTAWVIRTLPRAGDRAALAGRLRADRVVVMAPTLTEVKARAEADRRPAWTVQAARRWWEQFSPHPDDESPETGRTPPETGGQPVADDASETDVEDTDADQEPETGKDWKAEAEKWQALARKNEKQAKANADAAAKLKDLEPLARRAKELEDAGKSDLERLTSEAQGHLARADKAEGELLRLRVAVRKGLSEVQAKRLVGSTEDELEEDADDLLASFKPAEPAKKDDDEKEAEPERDPNPRRRPQERLRPGAVPDADTDPVEMDPRKLAAGVRRDVF